MTNTTTEGERRPWEVVESGSMIEAIGGFAAVVLALLGLASVLPGSMAAVAAVVVGLALLMEGAAVAARYSRLVAEDQPEARAEAEVSGGISAEFVGGAAGIILGLLALIGIQPMVLVPVAAIVFSGALLIGSTANARLNRLLLRSHRYEHDPWLARVARETVNAASGAEFMIGVGSGVLGVLAIVGVGSWLILSLVALLSVGVAVLLTGTAVSGKLISLLRR